MPENKSMFHVGIDLGTTNTVVATCNPPKDLMHPICRPNARGINQYLSGNQFGVGVNLPSVLFIDNDGVVKVGEYAKQKKMDGARDKILYNTKIDMGQKVTYANGFTPVRAAAEILKVCCDSIKTYVKPGEEFPYVTITVPASFTQSQIADTIEAAERAGFSREKVAILEEPVAALFCYINDQIFSGDEVKVDFSEKKRVMVYDIGGGTCDVCIVDLEIKDGTYSRQFIDTNRYTAFGGNDFDEAAAVGLLNKLFETYHISEDNIKSTEIKNDLVSKVLPFCEQCKIWYAQRIKLDPEDQVQPVAPFILDDFFGNSNVALNISYKEYLAYTRDFFQDNYTHPTRDQTDRMRDKNVIKPVYQILQKLKENGEPGIDCIFLTGGMSEYYPIEKALKEFCKVPIIKPENPMEVVAKGAAMSVYLRANNVEKNNVVNVQGELQEDPAEESVGYSRPKLAESIFIDIENRMPLKIIDSEIEIPYAGVVDYEFKVSSHSVRFSLFAGASEYDPEMRILYDYSRDFDFLVEPNTKARIRYEINENRFLRMFLDLEDERRQTFELTVDTTY